MVASLLARCCAFHVFVVVVVVVVVVVIVVVVVVVAIFCAVGRFGCHNLCVDGACCRAVGAVCPAEIYDKVNALSQAYFGAEEEDNTFAPSQTADSRAFAFGVQAPTASGANPFFSNFDSMQ